MTGRREGGHLTKLVGYKKITSKKSGKHFCVVSVLSDLSAREQENGAVGQKVEEIFLPEEQTDFLKPADIGKEFFVNYNISGGRAYVTDVSVK